MPSQVLSGRASGLIPVINMENKLVFRGDVTEDQINWGNHDDPRGVLVPGEKYTLLRQDIHSWHTKIFLAEFPGMSFNSVWFDTD
mgnify:FL=1